MRHSIFAVRPKHWWQRLSPSWYQRSADIQAWLDQNQFRILTEFRYEQLRKLMEVGVEKAVLNDAFGRNPVDPV